MRLNELLAAAFALTLAFSGVAAAASDGKPEVAPKKPFSVIATFNSICGLCHQDYGRVAGMGPQLMDDPNSDEFLFNRIKHGKPGRMAAWGSLFTDDQIHQIVKFIRNLKPDQEPKNP